MKSIVFIIFLSTITLNSANIVRRASHIITNIKPLLHKNTIKESIDIFKDNDPNPKIISMHVKTNITNRFATTLVTSHVKNAKNNASEMNFSMILPENAYISQLILEIAGKKYKALVKEKEEAKDTYNEAVSQGEWSAHLAQNPRDSNVFTLSLNMEAYSKAVLFLTYEELLQRQKGRYELIINIYPGQVIKDMDVLVKIDESRPLAFVETPSLRTGNEISKNEPRLKPSTTINIVNKTSAVVHFHPDAQAQTGFASLLGKKKENGLSGQFIVQYDVKRDPFGGEILVKDGYFVHFFAPTELGPLPKHVVFVLDYSGSMSGRKIEQLDEAMKNILSELKTVDVFNIVRFSDWLEIWNNENYISVPDVEDSQSLNSDNLSILDHLNILKAIPATAENIRKAQKSGDIESNMRSTNIMAGLKLGLLLTRIIQNTFPNKYQPLLIFLTDGGANIGITDSNEIIKKTIALNTAEATIFSLSFGEYANKDFLRKLSLMNRGFSRHIYEDSDASLQLQDFYQVISSPLMSNITFKYTEKVTNLTKTHYPMLFNGSELVVVGKVQNDNSDQIYLPVCGWRFSQSYEFQPVVEKPVTSLERLWAYLTVRKLLENSDDNKELKKKALELSLRYSFVTPVSSLVVVKPNSTDEPLRAVPKSHEVHQSNSYYRGRAMNFGVLQAMYPSSRSIHRSHHFLTLASVPNPQWIKDILSQSKSELNGALYTYNSTTYNFGYENMYKNETFTCNNIPQPSFVVEGMCKVLFNCPSAYNKLPDFVTYLKYSCKLNEVYGICCPDYSI